MLTPLPPQPSSASTPLADLSSLADLAEALDKAALPTYAASVLSAVTGSTRRTRPLDEADRARSWGLLLRSGYEHDRASLFLPRCVPGRAETDAQPLLAAEHLARLSHWIVSHLEHELYDLNPTEAGHARVEDLLCRARDICELGGVRPRSSLSVPRAGADVELPGAQELLEALEPFLASFLFDWDGERHRAVIFQLVALLKPRAWTGPSAAPTPFRSSDTS